MTEKQWKDETDNLVWLQGENRVLLNIDVAFRHFDIRVYQADMGDNIDGKYLWPMVAFQCAQDLQDIEDHDYEIIRRLERQDYANKKEEKRLESEHDRLYEQARLANLPARIKVLKLLEEFYQNRQVPYGTELIVTNFDFAYAVIENAGYQTYYQLPLAEQEKYYDRCRQEFIAFGEFLKQKILSTQNNELN